MATVTKDFRVKNGLVVEGANGTIDGSDIITASLIAGGTQENITVTYDAVNKQVNFVAENGVADSTTDDLVEGLTNLYFTDERAQDAIDAALSGGHDHLTITYDDNANTFSITTDATSANTGDTLVERDSSGNFAAGNITADLTGNADTATALETSRTITVSGDVDGSASFDGSADADIAVTLDTVNTDVGTFGSSTDIPSVTVDAKGRVTAVTTNSVATDLSIAGDSGTDTVSLLNDTLTVSGGTGTTVAVTDNSITVNANLGTGLEADGSDNIQIDSTVATLDGVQTLTNKTLGTSVSLSDDLDAGGQTITNLAEPTQSTHAATKNYVDTVAEGLSVKPAVLAATSSNLSGTYDNGTGGIDATLNLGPLATLDIDGVTTWQEFDGVLVKDQTNAFENGRYFVTQVGDATTDWILNRCPACDEADEVPSAYVFVQEGTQYNATGWVAEVENPSTFTVGTDDITWIQFSGAGTYIAGNGLTLNGTEFEIDTTITADVDSAQTLTNKSIAGDQNTLTNVPNSALVNDSITVNGQSTALGQSVTLDTDDVGEGTGNLYFTDARAVSALQGTDSSFNTVDIDSVAKQVAATASVTGTGSPEVVYSFDSTTHRSAKFLVKLSAGAHTEVSEILVTLDTSNNVAITEYAIVGTNGNIGDVSASYNAGDLEITITATAAADATVMGTLLV